MDSDLRASKKQQALLTFVSEFIKEHDYGPSYREIMTGLEYKSVSTVAAHIESLIAKGFLERKDNSARSLSIVSRASESAAVIEIKQAILKCKSKEEIENVILLEKALELLKEAD